MTTRDHSTPTPADAARWEADHYGGFPDDRVPTLAECQADEAQMRGQR